MINITSVSINNISVWSTSNRKESKVKHINGIKVSAISHTKGQSARFRSPERRRAGSDGGGVACRSQPLHRLQPADSRSSRAAFGAAPATGGAQHRARRSRWRSGEIAAAHRRAVGSAARCRLQARQSRRRLRWWLGR